MTSGQEGNDLAQMSQQAVYDCLLFTHIQCGVKKNELTKANNGIHLRIILSFYRYIIKLACKQPL